MLFYLHIKQKVSGGKGSYLSTKVQTITEFQGIISVRIESNPHSLTEFGSSVGRAYEMVSKLHLSADQYPPTPHRVDGSSPPQTLY